MSESGPETGSGTGARNGAGPDQQGGSAPETPAQLSRGAWLAAGKRAAREFSTDFLQDRAAALTYYGMLAIFPALLVLVSLLGLIGKSATQPLIINLAQAAPSTVRQTLLTAVNHLQHSHASAGRDYRDSGRFVVGLQLHRRVHARFQCHLRRA